MTAGAVSGCIWLYQGLIGRVVATRTRTFAPCPYSTVRVRVRVIYQAPRSRVRVDTAGEDEAEPQARPSTSWPDPPVHGDEGPDINRVVWSEMNATASGLYGS